jgi:hypothetical protein
METKFVERAKKILKESLEKDISEILYDGLGKNEDMYVGHIDYMVSKGILTKAEILEIVSDIWDNFYISKGF